MGSSASPASTPIAFERYGDRPPIVLVGGTVCDRGSHSPLAEQIADRYTAITIDRRRHRLATGASTPTRSRRRAIRGFRT